MQRAIGQQIDFSPGFYFQVHFKRDKIEQIFSTTKLDEQIKIAVRRLFTASKRSKQSCAFDLVSL